MTPQLTLQLYTLRDALSENFEATFETIREIGFKNVEPAGLSGRSPKEYAKYLNALGLKAPSAHSPLPIGDDRNKVIDTALEIGCRYLITGCPPAWQENFTSIDGIKRTAELYTEAAENATKHGLFVGYHNHDWDLLEVEGQSAYRVFLENTPETVLWETDVFWVARAGLDPVAFIQEIGARGRLLHLKDGHLKNREITPPFLPAGAGEVDLITAAKSSQFAEYSAVELDAYDGDMLDAVRKSYQFLTEQGLAQC